MTTDVLIIGTGFGGLCMGAKLKQAGFDNFTILEKAECVGGTWRENRYPGAECDIASVLYSYSFYPNPTWDFKWARQKQILEYLNGFADDMGLREHIRFGARVDGLSFDEKTDHWIATLGNAEIIHAKYVVTALGQLHHPKIPDIEGRSIFKGQTVHTAEWHEGIDLENKSVGIIGNAASAIQAIPEIAKVAKRLTIYQRSANWIIPKRDRPYSKLEKSLAKFIPGLSKLYRGFWFCVGEFFIYPIIRGDKWRSRIGRAMCKMEMKRYIKEPELREKLIPDYPIGAKRILLSEAYYPALARDNVELVTEGVDRFVETGLKSTSGISRDHDVIIFATGFHTHPFYKNLTITGEGGQKLSEKWRDGAYAYYGVMTAGFPNLFMLYGPNTNSGHTSIVFKLENQVNYIMKLLDKGSDNRIEVKPDAEQAYAEEMQSRLSETSWAKIKDSWYKIGDRIDLNWPGSGREYKRRMRTPVWDDFVFQDRESCERHLS